MTRLPPTRLPYLSTRQLLSFALAQRLGAQLGLAPGSAALVETAEGWLLFHWLGDVYGQALLDLLQPMLPVEGSAQPGLCLLLRDEPRSLPELNSKQVTRYLHDHERQYEGLLALGAYQHLLPRNLRRQAVVEQFDVACFVQAVADLRPARATERGGGAGGWWLSVRVRGASATQERRRRTNGGSCAAYAHR